MTVNNKFIPDPDLKLIDQVKQVLRYHHYAYRTEKSYVNWVKKYIKFFKCKKHPKDMGKKEIEKFLSYLAIHLDIASEIYTHVMEKDINTVISPLDSLQL